MDRLVLGFSERNWISAGAARLMRSVCLLLWVSLAAVASHGSSAEQGSDTAIGLQAASSEAMLAEIELKQGQPVEREIAGGESQSYRITLRAGQYLNVIAQQRVDVEFKLSTPDGKLLAAIDLQGKDAPEALWAKAELSGEYKLEVLLPNKLAKAGQYTVEIERIGEWENASPREKTIVKAYELYCDASQLRDEGKAESFRKAIDKYNESLPLWRAVENLAGEASSVNEIGFIYSRLGERSKALEYYKQALTLWRAVGNRRDEALALNNIGGVHRLLGNLPEALQYLEQALSLGRLLGSSQLEAITLNTIGTVYDVLGERQLALEHYQESLPLRRALGDVAGEARTLNNMGITYEWLGEYEKSLDCHSRALLIRRSQKDQRGEAISLNNLGTLYTRTGDIHKSLAYHEQSLPLRRAVGDRGGEAYTLSNIGAAYSSLGEVQKALDYHQQALVLRRAVGDRYGEAYTLANIGSSYASINENQKALDYYRQALQLNRTLGDKDGEVSNLHAIARAEGSQGRLTEAVVHIEAALKIVEAKRVKVISPELRVSYLASNQNLYQSYLDFLMQLHQRDPSAGHDTAAYHASERARARGLLDLLSEARSGVQLGIDAKVKVRERAIHSRISWLQNELRLVNSQAKPDQNRITTVDDELKKVEAERQQLEEEIRSKHPRYADLQYPSPIGLKAVQQLLDEKTVLLEYSLGKESSFLFAITKSDCLTARVPAASALMDAVTSLRAAIATKPDRAALSNYLQKARSLYQGLIQPAARLLHGKKALIVVPDGILYYLPFEVLLQSDSGRTAQVDLHNLPYLVRDYAISYAPSATVLATLRSDDQQRHTQRKMFLAYGDPVYRKTESAQSEPVRAAVRSALGNAKPWDLQQLPNSRGEVERIAGLHPPGQISIFLGEQANEENVKASDRLGQYRYIHFAVHGLLNESRPQYSGLVLSVPKEESEETGNQERQTKRETDASYKNVSERADPQTAHREDGLLQVYEIFNLRFNAELVVLSACETGLGKEVRGEGLIGLTRAFMYAGAPSLVVSLWKVHDRSTAELMVRFYAALKNGRGNKAEALRQARLHLIGKGQFAHPHYWAGFVLMGRP